MKLLFLWGQWTGYMDANVAAVVRDFGAEVTAFHRAGSRGNNFNASQFSAPIRRVSFDQRPTLAAVSEVCSSQAWDGIFCSSWNYPSFELRLIQERAIRKTRPTLTLCMDNQWRGDVRQRIGAAVLRQVLPRLFDAALVAGERQAVFARNLGFAASDIFSPLYSGDSARFLHPPRPAQSASGTTRFLIVSRLVPEKGIADIVAAADLLQREGHDDFECVVCGAGPLLDLVTAHPRIRVLGFRQPAEMPAVFVDSDCFIQASHFEPWGVAIHEAALAGLPLICSDACGAADLFLIDGENGHRFRQGDAQSLYQAMRRFLCSTSAERATMAEKSYSLGRRVTSESWASNVVKIVRNGAVNRK